MDNIQYVGEALWIGKICKALIFVAFITSILSTISYYFATSKRMHEEGASWKQIGKYAFIIQGVSILSLFLIMISSMLSHHYEYAYVFDHVNGDLPLKYIFSAFWEGQEGSFILWMNWHIILGFILIKINDEWHAPVLFVIALAQAWLASMLLGIHLDMFGEDFKIGSNPMMLIRDNIAAPIFTNADYLSLIKGKGLNPLLQNYWMTIHPPTLFLGFALTIVPFAYSIAALWTKTYREVLRPVLNWALLTAAVLGIGILMGSLWAYEALSFGGYWAWDPVENTSLVPWIIVVGGIHANLIANSTGHGIRSSFIFYLLCFLLIVYSTLLTRSGILGDTSAHAFTEMGLEWQLTFFLFTFILMGFGFYFYRFKNISSPEKEESVYSREFWMYVGSLILLFSGILIDSSSSLPVLNTITRYFDPSYVGKVIKDPIEHYNKYQLWISIFIGLLSGITIWLKYKTENKLKKETLVRIGIHLASAAALTFLTTLWIVLPAWQHYLMAFTAFYTVVSNIDFLLSNFVQNKRSIAAAISHVGFGLMIVGILATGLNFRHLNNPFLFKGLFDEGGEQKYVQLIKGKPLLLQEYLVTYLSDTVIGNARYYDVSFKQLDKNLNVIDSFITRPDAVYANDFSKIAAFNPDTRHYFSKDIFTCIVSLPPAISDSENAKAIEDSLKFSAYRINAGDTIKIDENYAITIPKLNLRPTLAEYVKNKHDVGYELPFTIIDKEGSKHTGSAAIGLYGNIIYKYGGRVEHLGLRIRPSEILFSERLTSEDELKYESLNLKQGETINWNGHQFTLAGFNKNVDSTRFKKEKDDIAVAAILGFQDGNSQYIAEPIYVIRDNAPMSIKDYVPELGIHVRLSNIDPKNGIFEIRVAKDVRKVTSIPFEVAPNVPRTDYIVMEAKIFPGINFFWLGTILMMIGLLVAWIFKLKGKK